MRFTELLESKQSFQLDPALDPDNYKISTFRNVSKWKAKVIEGNSVGDGDPDVGEWDDVGYIMINLSNNYIIPIARGDEHHTGYDLVNELGIDYSKYMAIYCSGNNYIFANSPQDVKKEIEKFKIAGDKWFSYGGPDVNVIVCDYSSNKNYTTPLSRVTDDEGDIVKNKLRPLGQLLYDSLNKIANEIRNQDNAMVPKMSAFTSTLKFIDWLKRTNFVYMAYNDIKKYEDAVKVARKNKDLKELENIMFGYPSLKNDIHQAIRDSIKPSDSFHDRIAGAVGDMSLMDRMLGSI